MATVEGQQANSNSVLEIRRNLCLFFICFLNMQHVTILAQGLSCHTSHVHSSLSHCVRATKVLADTFYQGLSSINLKGEEKHCSRDVEHPGMSPCAVLEVVCCAHTSLSCPCVPGNLTLGQ